MKKNIISTNLESIQTAKIEVEISGIGPGLLMHRLDASIGEAVERKRAGKKDKAKNMDEVFVDWKQTLHSFPDYAGKMAGKPGIPARNIKKAIVSSANLCDVAKTDMRKCVFIKGTFKGCEEYCVLEGEPIEHHATVRIGGRGGPGTGAPADRVRALFPTWTSKFVVEYNASVISAEMILNIINAAGWHNGLCEDRPEKSGGDFGRFEILH